MTIQLEDRQHFNPFRTNEHKELRKVRLAVGGQNNKPPSNEQANLICFFTRLQRRVECDEM